MYKLFPQHQRSEASLPQPAPNGSSGGGRNHMDAASTAAALACVATMLTRKIKSFRSRMKTKPSLLNTLIRWCSVVESDATLIVEELQGLNPLEVQTDGSWRMLGQRLFEMKEHLEDFSRQLGELTDTSATTELGRSMLAMETAEDDLLPEVKQIQDEIDWRYRSLQVWLPFALQQSGSQRANSITSTVSAPAQVLTPPLTPDDRSIHTTSSNGNARGPSARRPSEASSNQPPPSIAMHMRRRSEASTITDEDSPTSLILKAARRTDVKAVKQLLEDDTTGELASTTDPSGRTLIDIVICSGKRTSKTQVPMVKLLREWGAKFTLTKNKQHTSAYKDIVSTIKFQSGSKR